MRSLEIFKRNHVHNAKKLLRKNVQFSRLDMSKFSGDKNMKKIMGVPTYFTFLTPHGNYFCFIEKCKKKFRNEAIKKLCQEMLVNFEWSWVDIVWVENFEKNKKLYLNFSSFEWRIEQRVLLASASNRIF